MKSEDGFLILCNEATCEASIKNDQWNKIKKGEGWFFTKSDDAYCPLHIPEWVPAWRKKRE